MCICVAYSSRERRVRNRWLVAYTLLRNPSLQGLTAANLPSPSSATPPSKEELLAFESPSPSPEVESLSSKEDLSCVPSADPSTSVSLLPISSPASLDGDTNHRTSASHEDGRVPLLPPIGQGARNHTSNSAKETDEQVPGDYDTRERLGDGTTSDSVAGEGGGEGSHLSATNPMAVESPVSFTFPQLPSKREQKLLLRKYKTDANKADNSMA